MNARGKSAKMILVTGATGLLGRQVYAKLPKESTIGCGFSRASGSIVRLNLIDKDQTREFLIKHSIKSIVHCAAERRPDVVAAEPEKAKALNISAVQQLSELCAELDIYLLYISTDYVFDGKNPPYNVNDKVHPLNEYGESKAAGESTINLSRAAILRVPVLYGPGKTDESAFNVLYGLVKNQKESKVDDYYIRYPTNTIDVAKIIEKLVKGKHVGIFHFSATEAYTKFQACQEIARALQVNADHLEPLKDADTSSASRPYNCQLSNDKLVNLGLYFDCIDFGQWFVSNKPE